jgi:hypothetical protein
VRDAARFALGKPVGVDDLELDRADTEAIAGSQRGVGECPAVDPRVRREAADHGGLGPAKDQAVQRLDAAGPESQRTARPGADCAFAGPKSDDLAVAGRAADAQRQFVVGDV